MRAKAIGLFILFVAASVIVGSAPARAQDANACDEPGDFPDVIVGDLPDVLRHGTSGGITAYSIATTSCNIGTCWLNWIDSTNEHPVIAQNMFRLRDGRFEQIGQSWLKHGFFALSETLCSNDCIGTGGSHLGVNCSDPYSSGLNGSQGGLGPRSEVNPSTGDYPYPFTTINQGGDAIYKRLQVHNSDLDPALNPGAFYFVEGQYVSSDDSAAGKKNNNASYRRVTVSGPNFDVSVAGSTVRQQPAIRAWSAFDTGVSLANIDVPGDGRFVAANKVTDLGNGTWSYEYAIQNLTSNRAAMTFTVPLPASGNVTGIDFHDVDYHSGEPYSSTDWIGSVAGPPTNRFVFWTTSSFATDPDANALRWGTLYNFRFVMDRPPTTGTTLLRLFFPGTPDEVGWSNSIPSSCNNDGSCDPEEDSCLCPGDCGPPSLTEDNCHDTLDDDCDGLVDCEDPDCCTETGCEDGIDNDGDSWAACDCNDNSAAIWTDPSPVRNLSLDHATASGTTLSWSEPLELGSDGVRYGVLRTSEASSFAAAADCLAAAPAGLTATDTDIPSSGECFHYLVRAGSSCPGGEGSLGTDSDGQARIGIACP